VPAEERREILLETRSHVLERTARAPAPVEAVLAELGPPEAYARQFLADAEPPADAAPATPAPDVVQGFARLATGRWTALPLLLVVVTGYAFALLLFLLAVSKLLEPDTTGLYLSDARGRPAFLIVWSDPGFGGREVLGHLFAPLALAIAAALHLLLRALLRRVARRP